MWQDSHVGIKAALVFIPGQDTGQVTERSVDRRRASRQIYKSTVMYRISHKNKLLQILCRCILRKATTLTMSPGRKEPVTIFGH